MKRLSALATAAFSTLLAASISARAAETAPAPAAAPADAYAKEIESFRQERIDGLKRPDGWLSLVGLFWLQEGENRFGSDPQNRVIFPEGSAPPVAGTFVRKGDAV